MSARSPVRDRRVIVLAAEVAETRDRKVPGVLLGLKSILDSTSPASTDGRRIRKEIWEFCLIDALILVLKHDYSIIEGQWMTAARLTTIFSQSVTGLDLPKDELKELQENKFPEAIANMFLVARRIQARFAQIPNRPSKEKERSFLLGTFKTVLESLIYIASGHLTTTHKILDSPWLLQLLISDNPETVFLVMELIQKCLRANCLQTPLQTVQILIRWLLKKPSDLDLHYLERTAIREMSSKTLYSIMDELIYKLTVENNQNLGAGATKTVLCVCEYHKPMVADLCIRYRGLRPLLGRWEGEGFSRDLKALFRLLEAGNAQRAELETKHDNALMIQAYWRGYITRKKLTKANKAFAKLHKVFRNRQKVREATMTKRKRESDAEHRGRMNRQRIMIEFKEKQLHCIEILPASKVESYLQNEKIQAATLIQKRWRGFQQRERLSGRKAHAKQNHAAILIQRTVRRWLERLDAKRGEMPIHLRPPGLTDERRVELQKEISNYREENPARAQSRKELESVHKKASELLAQYYSNIKHRRKAEQKREALLARLETDSELCALAPSLESVTQKDVEMYSSRSVPVATKARVNHMEMLRNLQLPWWKKLDDEFQDTEIPEEEMLLF